MSSDASVRIEELLEHRGWVRALARVLVADDAQADDVAQQVWLEAIEHPPAHGGALRAWFARIVRRRARDAWRQRERRGRREAVRAPRGNSPSAAAVVAEADAHRRLVDAVMELDEPFRATVLLRFFEDLPPREIALRTGVPVETAKTRLKRAIALLRSRLDDGSGGDRGAWVAALAPLTANPTSALVQGGLAVTTKTKAALGLAAALLLALTMSVVLGGRDEPPPIVTAASAPPAATPVVVEEHTPPSPPAPAPVRPVVVPAPAAVAPAPARPPAPEPKPAPPAMKEPVGTATVFGAVRFAATRKPAAGQKVSIGTAGRPAAAVVTDAEGRFRFEKLAEGVGWRVGVEAKDFAPVVVPNVHLDRDEARDVGTLWLDVPVRLDVVVKDWADRPIAAATVEAHRTPPSGVADAWTHAVPYRDVPGPVASAATDAAGRAFLTLPPGQWTVVAGAAGFAAAWEWGVTLAPGATEREVTLHLDRALRIEGRIVDGDSRPVPRVFVWALCDKWADIGSAVYPRAVTDDAGNFVVDGLRPGDVALRVGRGGMVPAEVARVRVPTSGRVEIVLDGGIMEGTVTGAPDGTPLAGARVLAYVSGQKGLWFAEAITDETGRYRLDTIRAGRPQYVRVERQGFLTLDESTPNPMSTAEVGFGGGPVTRDFTLRRGVPLAGHVTSADGPVAGARVVANWYDRSPNGKWLVQAEAYTEGDGRFSFSGVAPQNVVVQVFADGWYQEGLADFDWSSAMIAGRKPPHSIDVPPGGLRDLRIVLTAACVVSGRVESAAGAPVAGATVWCMWSRTTTGVDGAFRLTAAVNGQAAQITAIGRPPTWTTQPVALSAAGRVEGVVIRLPRTVRIGGRVATASGAAVDGASVEVVFRPEKAEWGMREWTVMQVPVLAGGRYDAEFLEKEGRILVRASAPGFASAESPPTVIETGRATYQADVVLGPSRALEGRVVSSGDGRTPVVGAKVALMPADRDGRPNPRTPRPLAAVTDAAGRFRVPDVAVGDTFLVVDATGFVSSITPIEVPLDSDLVVKLEPSMEIAGVVKLADGSVAPNVWVGLKREHDNGRDNWWSVATDADGRFRATGLRSGTYEVSVHVFPGSGNTFSVAPFKTSGVAAGRTDVVLVLQPAGEIAGRVLGPDGRPLAECSVQAFSETGDPYAPSAISNDDGTFVVRGIGVGTYRLEAKPPESQRTGFVMQGAEFRAAKVTGIASGAKDVEIRLTGGQSIRGTLLDAAGKPLASAWLRADPLPGQGIDMSFMGIGAQTDAAGRFAIAGLAAGRYRLVQVPDPQRIDVSRPLGGGNDVAAGANDVRIVAGGASRIAGIVVDEKGEPVAHANVTAKPAGGGAAVFVDTLADGTFVLDGVSDLARCVLTVSRTEFLGASVEDVAPGASDVRIRLARGLRATGRILSSDDRTFANGFVTLTQRDGDHRATVRTDAEGRFAATGLHEGVYVVVELLMTAPSGSTPKPRSCGTIRAGDLDVEMRIVD